MPLRNFDPHHRLMEFANTGRPDALRTRPLG